MVRKSHWENKVRPQSDSESWTLCTGWTSSSSDTTPLLWSRQKPPIHVPLFGTWPHTLWFTVTPLVRHSLKYKNKNRNRLIMWKYAPYCGCIVRISQHRNLWEFLCVCLGCGVNGLSVPRPLRIHLYKNKTSLTPVMLCPLRGENWRWKNCTPVLQNIIFLTSKCCQRKNIVFNIQQKCCHWSQMFFFFQVCFSILK